MNKKTYLEAPSAELIVVRFEGNFCATGNYSAPGAAGRGFSSTNGNIYDLTEEDDF